MSLLHVLARLTGLAPRDMRASDGVLVELARYSDSMLAHVVRGRLETAGIPAFCFDSGMNVAESVPMLFQVRLMVLDDDLDEARALLAEAEAPSFERHADRSEGA